MLAAPIQKDIKNCYQNLKDQLDNFIPRRAQNYLVAEIAKTLSGEYDKKRRILVAEAGTGIGKSLAYLIGAIPFAMANNKKVVISTATVALQEQLLNKDLPLFYRVYQKELLFILAKGRQRYCCAHKLANLCEEDPQQMALLTEKPKKGDLDLIKRLYIALSKNKWDGDRDNWPVPIPNRIWLQMVADKHSCNPSLSMHRGCPFQKAREHLDRADVIIANHSLLLADIELGGGVILPEPEQAIYIIDEAHHLPKVARDFSAASASLKGACSWLDKVNSSSTKLAKLGDYSRADKFLNTVRETVQFLIPTLTELAKQIDPAQLNKDGVYRFPHGELPAWLEQHAVDCREMTKKAHLSYAKLHDLVMEKAKENQISNREADPILAEAGFYLQRLENLEKVWQLMAQPEKPNSAPLARWIEKSQDREDDYVVEVSPIEVGWRLDQLLWSRAAGVVMTSATLRALNSFNYFCRQVGISENDGSHYLALSSPFDYQNQAQLVIPKVKYEPQAPEFTELLTEMIPEYLEGQKASLVLFSSYWQMNQVADSIRSQCKKNKWQLLVQGEESRQELIKKHQENCKKGKTSILFGTGSFSEGLDLPGDLLTNVIITKIPFAVPTSPIEEAHAEFIESKGGNPFLQISVPDASKKLIQSAGRLLRKERDAGRVVILDRRVITKRYGKSLLDALPPFNRVIEH
ncbi:ATP-dependent DNA helicase DinG [Vibrio sp. SS-MA-C1-2]|uniref:ATP-dependent DNA helicase DinG n=1 Tax=Vibrio sp. SS-MA-C1-2 TaxID=2908646 RepID=UPI001F3007BD|nr:ATP-dependent DNA helicase DinG [Vibrio sp. SS-MA-C1-2]UJF18677.1 ATP-dependent DNA helicase DinG [Vibrio sp. SS-MA-C1-2]